MAIQVVLPIFLIITFGFLFGRLKKIDISPLSEVTLYVAMPCLIISSLLNYPLFLNNFLQIALGAWFIIFGVGIAVFLFLKGLGQKIRGFYLPCMFMNCGNLGFPVALFAFGQEGLAVAVVFAACDYLVLYSLGIWLVADKSPLKQVFKVPLIYAAVIGILFSIFKIELPAFLAQTIEIIGRAAIPLLLFTLGYRLSYAKVQKFWLSFSGCWLRMGVGFLAGLAFVALSGASGIIRSIILINSAMPAAVGTQLLSEKYKRDPELVASIIALSTTISIFTIPLILNFLKT